MSDSSANKKTESQGKQEKMPKGWQEKKLGEFMEFKNGVNAEKEAYGRGVKFVNLMDIFKKPFLGKDDIDGSVDISPVQAVEYSVQEGDILFNRTSETPEEIAFAAVYTGKEKITFGGFVIRGRQSKNLLLPAFAGYCFQNNLVRKALVSKCQGAVRANIGQKELSQIPIQVPPVAEQEKIAAILRTWDDAIEKQDKIISNLQQERKALLGNLLLNQQTNKPLKFFAKPVAREVDKPTSAYHALGIRSHCKGTFQRFIKDASTVAMETLYQVRENDLIVNITFAWEGAIALVKKDDENCLVSHRFPTHEIDTSKALPQFVRHVVQTRKFIEQLGIISPGGAGRNRVLNKKDFLELRIWLPDLQTQQNISDIISTIETEIGIAEMLLDKFKLQKRGLMQKLLTGEWPIKTSEKEAA